MEVLDKSDATSLESVALSSGHRLPTLVVLFRKVVAVSRAVASARLQQESCSTEERLHTTYIQGGNVTGRIYTDAPNLQCMPNQLDLERCSKCDMTVAQEMKQNTLQGVQQVADALPLTRCVIAF